MKNILKSKRTKPTGWTGKHLAYTPGGGLDPDLFPVRDGRVVLPSVMLGEPPRHSAEFTV